MAKRQAPHARRLISPHRRLPFDPAAAAAAVLSLPQVRRAVLGEDDPVPQPLLPPRAGHLALLLAGGALTGIVVRDERGHPLLLRGRSAKFERRHDLPPGRLSQEAFSIEIDALDLEERRRFSIYGAGGDERLTAFLEATREEMATAAARHLSPRVAHISADEIASLPPLVRPPLGMQGPAVVALRYALRRLGRALVVGEQGCGKTYISLAGAYAAGCRRILVLCPPHLASKWAREARLTIPGATAIVCRRPQDLERAKELGRKGRPIVCIVTREAAKLSYEERPATVALLLPEWRHACSPDECEQSSYYLDGRAMDRCTGQGRILTYICRDARGQPKRVPSCPDCFLRLADRPDAEAPRRCPRCGAKLVAARAGIGPRRYPLSRYIARRLRGTFQCLIIDEAHEYRSQDSLQAEAAMRLASVVPRVICLTGTLLGGYASHLYNILVMISPQFRRLFHPREGGRSRFAKEYGLTAVEQRPWQRQPSRRPLPGVSPKVAPWLLERGIYLRLEEVVKLPPLQEDAVLVEPSPELGRAIARLHAMARRRLDERERGSGQDAAALMHALLSYPDLAWAGEEVMGADGSLLLRAAPLGDGPLPKEEALVRLVEDELARGRPCLVYVTYTGSRDITGRLQEMLAAAGVRADVLRAEAVPPARREAWLLSRMAQGVQALICQPRLVALGLDLIAFPTVVFFQPDPDPFVVRQAARRSYRIGQRQPVRVVYMAYRGSAQELLLSILARKAAASLLIEGEALGGGLLPLSEDDTLAELARQVARGEAAEDAREQLRRAAEAAAWAGRRAGWEAPPPQAVGPSLSIGVQLALPGV